MNISSKVTSLLLVLFLGLTASFAWAEDPPCPENQSFEDCFLALNKKLIEALETDENKKAAAKEKAEATQAATSEADQEVKEKSTADVLSTDGSALNDALSTFAAAAGAQGAEGDPLFAFDQKLFEIGLDCQKPSDGDGESSEKKCRRTIPVHLKAEIVEAEVLEALKEAIPEDIREERVATLEKDLDSFDSIDVQLRASLEDGNGKFRWGRSANHYEDILDGFYTSVIDPTTEASVATQKYLQWQGDMGRWLGELGLGDQALAKKIKDLERGILEKLDSNPAACQAECEARIEEFAKDKADCRLLQLRVSSSPNSSEADRNGLTRCELLEIKGPPPLDCAPRCRTETREANEALVSSKIKEGQNRLEASVSGLFEARQQNWEALTKGKLSELATLIDNQPQAYLEINYKERGELSGPDETSAKLVFEFGLVNVNGLQKWASDSKNQKDGCDSWDDNEKSLGCLENFLKEKGGNLGDANRFALSIERVEVDDFAFALPNDGVDFRLDAVDKTIGSLSYGRRLTFDDQGSEMARLDISISHEDVSDDPDRQDRTLAELTITRKLIGDFSLAVGLQWANKPEYLVDEDGEELGGRIAIGWKAFAKKKAENGGSGDS